MATRGQQLQIEVAVWQSQPRLPVLTARFDSRTPGLQELMAGGTLKALLVDAYYSTSSTRLFSRTVRTGFRV